jgi:nucleoid-associated protein YgaU
VSPEEKGKQYKVRKGDSLWSIAHKFYHDGSKSKLIYEANKDKIPKSGFLKPGTQLVIPELKESAPATVKEQPSQPATTSAEGGTYYTVKKGDSLWKIAHQFYYDGSKLNVIFEANKDKLATTETPLKPGEKLFIPTLAESKKKTSVLPPEENVPKGVPETGPGSGGN